MEEVQLKPQKSLWSSHSFWFKALSTSRCVITFLLHPEEREKSEVQGRHRVTMKLFKLFFNTPSIDLSMDTSCLATFI